MSASLPRAESVVTSRRLLRRELRRLTSPAGPSWRTCVRAGPGRRQQTPHVLCVASTAQAQQLKTVDDATWNEKYASSYGTLAFGESLIQGRRESMEDTAVVIPRARCGYLFAGKNLVASCIWLRKIAQQKMPCAMSEYFLISCVL